MRKRNVDRADLPLPLCLIVGAIAFLGVSLPGAVQAVAWQPLAEPTAARAECADSPAADRLNIVWIISDDLSPDLGCYGYEGVRTPAVDRLAAKGVRFTHAFATSPVCSPSRSALITGVHQTVTGTHHHRTLDKRPLPSPVEPITEILRRAGYFVCNSDSQLRRAGKTDYNFASDIELFDGVDWSISDKGRAEGQPFFAQVQIHQPHRTFASAPNRELFAECEIPPYYPDHPIVRADWADYLHSVEVMDRSVARVVKRLEEEQLLDRTVIFFFGDHGRPHYRDKQWLYDGGLRVPLVICGPIQPTATVRNDLVSLLDVAATTVALAGQPIPAWMEGHDLFDRSTEERSSVFAARDRMGSTLDRVRSVRTKRFKYIRNFYPERPYSQHSGYKKLQYPALTVAQVLFEQNQLEGPPARFWAAKRPGEELYDLEVDPNELENLAEKPEYQDELRTLRYSLDDWIESTQDQGRNRETGEAEAVRQSDAWYRGQLEKRGFSADYQSSEYLRWWSKKLRLGQPN